MSWEALIIGCSSFFFLSATRSATRLRPAECNPIPTPPLLSPANTSAGGKREPASSRANRPLPSSYTKRVASSPISSGVVQHTHPAQFDKRRLKLRSEIPPTMAGRWNSPSPMYSQPITQPFGALAMCPKRALLACLADNHEFAKFGLEVRSVRLVPRKDALFHAGKLPQGLGPVLHLLGMQSPLTPEGQL